MSARKKFILVGMGIGAALAVALPSVFAILGEGAEAVELDILKRPQSDGDVLPTLILESDHDLIVETSRQVFDREKSGWIVKTESGDICLVLSVDEGTAGRSCATPALFNSRGVAVQVGTPDSVAEAYIVPDALAIGSPFIYVDPFSTTKAQTVDARIDPEIAARIGFTVAILPVAVEPGRPHVAGAR